MHWSWWCLLGFGIAKAIFVAYVLRYGKDEP